MSERTHSEPVDPLADAGYRDVPAAVGGRVGRSWWDANADEYLDEHGDFLGPADFCWCPEGVREADAHLLGDLEGARVLEIGAGAAQCSRWLARRGVQVVATDVSAGMLASGARYDTLAGVQNFFGGGGGARTGYSYRAPAEAQANERAQYAAQQQKLADQLGQFADQILTAKLVPALDKATKATGAHGRAAKDTSDIIAGQAVHYFKVVAAGEAVDANYVSMIQLVPKLTERECRELIASGVIDGGMVPKVEACFEALDAGAGSALILDGRVPFSLLDVFLHDTFKGTAITR